MKMNKALYGAVYVCVIDPVPIARLYELPSPKKMAPAPSLDGTVYVNVTASGDVPDVGDALNDAVCVPPPPTGGGAGAG